MLPVRPGAARADTAQWPAVQCKDKEAHAAKYGLRMCVVCSGTEPCRECHGPDAPRFRRCARCKVVIYCSVDCQRKHWRHHKPHCIAPMRDTDADQRELAEYAQYRSEGLGIEPTMHMSDVSPLLQKWMEIYAPLLIVAALNAWHFVGPHPPPSGPKIFEIDIVVGAPTDGLSTKTRAAKAFLVRDARPYHTMAEFEDMVARKAWHTPPEFTDLMVRSPEMSERFRESYVRYFKDREERTAEMREMYPKDGDRLRTNLIIVMLWFDNEIFQNVYSQHFCFSDDRRKIYREPAWVEEDWLGFLKTNVAAGKPWSREGISF